MRLIEWTILTIPSFHNLLIPLLGTTTSKLPSFRELLALAELVKPLATSSKPSSGGNSSSKIPPPSLTGLAMVDKEEREGGRANTGRGVDGGGRDGNGNEDCGWQRNFVLIECEFWRMPLPYGVKWLSWLLARPLPRLPTSQFTR